MLWVGAKAQRSGQLPRFLLRPVSGIDSGVPFSPSSATPIAMARLCLAPLAPSVFFNPASLSASNERLISDVEMPPLTDGPLRSGLTWFSFLVVIALAIGDHVIKYLALWSLRLVVLVSKLQEVLIKEGSRSSVGAGVGRAHTWDQFPKLMSRLWLLMKNGAKEFLQRPRVGVAKGRLFFPSIGAVKASFSPKNGVMPEAAPVYGLLRTCPLASLNEG